LLVAGGVVSIPIVLPEKGRSGWPEWLLVAGVGVSIPIVLP